MVDAQRSRSGSFWFCRNSIVSHFLFLQGMRYITNSPLHCHGNLKSRNCIVDSRWVLKITDYHLNEMYSLQNSSRQVELSGLFFFSFKQKLNFYLFFDRRSSLDGTRTSSNGFDQKRSCYAHDQFSSWWRLQFRNYYARSYSPRSSVLYVGLIGSRFVLEFSLNQVWPEDFRISECDSNKSVRVVFIFNATFISKKTCPRAWRMPCDWRLFIISNNTESLAISLGEDHMFDRFDSTSSCHCQIRWNSSKMYKSSSSKWMNRLFSYNKEYKCRRIYCCVYFLKKNLIVDHRKWSASVALLIREFLSKG